MKKRIYLTPLLLLAALACFGQQKQPPVVKPGKYGCTSSKYVNGSYEFLPKGSFLLSKGGTYSYNGFEKPSTGTFAVDAAGAVLFKGGYFN